MIENKSIFADPTMHSSGTVLGPYLVYSLDSEQYWKLSTIFFMGLVLLIAVLFFHDRGLALPISTFLVPRMISFPTFEIQDCLYHTAHRLHTEHKHNHTMNTPTVASNRLLLLGKILLFAALALFFLIQTSKRLLGTNLVLLAITAGMVLMSVQSYCRLLWSFYRAYLLGCLSTGLLYWVLISSTIRIDSGSVFRYAW